MDLISELFLLVIFCLALWYVGRRMYKNVQASKKGRGCSGCSACSLSDCTSGCEGIFKDMNENSEKRE
jgi:fumarate reductase subunit D